MKVFDDDKKLIALSYKNKASNYFCASDLTAVSFVYKRLPLTLPVVPIDAESAYKQIAFAELRFSLFCRKICINCLVP